MNKIVAMAIAALMFAAVPASAEQTVSGTILAPSGPAWWVGDGITGSLYTQAGIVMNGVDGWMIELDDVYSEFTLSADPGVVGACDLDVQFYDANGGITGEDGDNGTENCGEDGEIDAGTTHALIINFVGFNVGFEFTAA